jgi:competence protein ComEA
MRTRKSSVARSAPRSWGSALGAATSSASPVEASVAHARAASWRVWAPLLLRAVALGIALLGLAGIGSVASRAPDLSPPPLARAGLEIGSLSTGAFSLLSAGAPPRPSSAPVQASSPPPAGASAAPPTPASNEPAATPCPGSAPVPDRGRSRPAVGELRVVLNQANAAQLQRLPGVGAKRAAAIVELRERLGRFRRPGDLLRIKGIGPRTLERMLPHLVLD